VFLVVLAARITRQNLQCVTAPYCLFSNVRLPQRLLSTDYSWAVVFLVLGSPAFEAPIAYADIPRSRAEITGKRDA